MQTGLTGRAYRSDQLALVRMSWQAYGPPMDAGRSAPSDFAGTRLECSDVRISWLVDGPPMDTGWSAPSNFARTRSERSDVQTSWLADGLPTDTGLAIRSKPVRPLGKTCQTGLFNQIWLGANFDSQQLGSLENVASFASASPHYSTATVPKAEANKQCQTGPTSKLQFA